MPIVCTACGESNRDGALVCGMCRSVLARQRAYVGASELAGIAPARENESESESENEGDSESDPHIVFLDPPHAPSVDLVAAASALGVAPADARMRVGLGIPAPVAVLDPAAASRLAAALARAGLAATLVPASALVATPSPEVAQAFALDERSFVFRAGDGSEARFAWSGLRAAFLLFASTIGVRRTRAEQDMRRAADVRLAESARYSGTRRGRRAAFSAFHLYMDSRGTLSETAQLSLHLVAEGTVGQRLQVVLPQRGLSYEGLGPHRVPGSGQHNWDALLGRIGAWAPHVTLDRRAERAPPKLPPVIGLPELFGGRRPDAAWVHAAFLAWKSLG